MALRLHSGRRAHVNHSYRCYSYGVAIAALEDIDVDRELLFAAAMLHDTGLSGPEAYLPSAGAGVDVIGLG